MMYRILCYMTTRNQTLLIDLLLDHLRVEKKKLKNEMVDQWDTFMEYRADRDETDNIAWCICNNLGELIRLRGDIAILLQIRRELAGVPNTHVVM